MGLLLGIDLGTTVLKVCAFDARSGAARGAAARRLPVRATDDGGREQRPADVDKAFGQTVRALRNEIGRDWRGVEGIGIAAQGGSSIIAERATGKARTPMYLWNDSRAHAHGARLAAETGVEFWREFTLRDVPPAGLGRLDWLRERHGGVFNDEHIHVGAGEYLFYRLTGEWRQDAGNAIQIGSYNAATGRLEDRALRLVGVPMSFVAPLRRGHETARLSAEGAKALGVPTGIPVAGPYIDQEAGYLSAAGVSRRPLHASLGTAWVGNFRLGAAWRGASAVQLALPPPTGGGRFVIQPLLAGNAVWDWALTMFGGTGRGVALERAAAAFRESPAAPDGLVALPYLTQRNPRDASAYGGGVFFGVSVGTTRADLLRAVACGLAFEYARVFSDLVRAGALDCVVLGGGASKGEYFRALLAALFAPMETRRQLDEDTAVARGALYALSRRAATAATRRVRPPAARVREQIMARYETHQQVFAEVYGAEAAFGAFRVERV